MATTKSNLRSKKSRRARTARRIHNLLSEHQDVIEEIGKPEEVFARGGVQYKFIEAEGLYVVEYKVFKSNKKYWPGFVKPIYSEKTTLSGEPLKIIRYDLLDEDKKLIHELSPKEAEKWMHDEMIRKPQSMTAPRTTEWFELRVKPSKLGTKEILNGAGGKDILYITYEGKNIARFKYNTHGYQEDFLLRNKDDRRMSFGEKSKMHQLAAFKKALKDGYTEIKDYSYMPEEKDDFAKGGKLVELKISGQEFFYDTKTDTLYYDKKRKSQVPVAIFDNSQYREFLKQLQGKRQDSNGNKYASGGITLSKVGDKVEEFVSTTGDSVKYHVHKYGDKFVVLVQKAGNAVADAGGKIYDSLGDAVKFAKEKAEQVFEAGGKTGEPIAHWSNAFSKEQVEHFIASLNEDLGEYTYEVKHGSNDEDKKWAVYKINKNKFEAGAIIDGQQLVETPGSTEDLQSLAYAKGGHTDYWIAGTIKHPGKLRRLAIREGLIKKDEKLSTSDLHKLETEGGTTAREAHEAETLASFHAKGGIIYQDKKLYRVKLADGKYVQFEGFDMYYNLHSAKNKEKLFEAEGGKMEEAFPKYGITDDSEESDNVPFMYFENKEDIKRFHKNPDFKIKIWKLKYKDDKYGWGGSPLRSGDVTQPVYAKGGKIVGKRAFTIESKQWYNTDKHKYTEIFFGIANEDGDVGDYIQIDWVKMDDYLFRIMEIDSSSWHIMDQFTDVYKKLGALSRDEITEDKVVEILKECGLEDVTTYEKKEGGGYAMPQRAVAAAGTVAVGIAPVHEVPQLEQGATLTEEKPARIPNSDSKFFTENKVAFTGNNLEGRTMPNGDYLVTAFGVYPLWLWCAKDKSWYGNEDKPNMGVSRMFSESRPDWNAKLIPHGQMISKSLEYAERYDLGGVMIKQLYPMSTDNTTIAHSGETNTII